MKELINIQFELKAPKGQYNKFGKYKYRSCEDILEAVKPLLHKYKCMLALSDEVKEIGGQYTQKRHDGKNDITTELASSRIYVEATATLINEAGEKWSVKALAREAVAKAGMDEAQITGAASSYARKYALNGLFAIDDTKDADALNDKPATQQAAPPKQVQAQQTNDIPAADALDTALFQIGKATTKNSLMEIYNGWPALQGELAFKSALSEKRKELENKK